MRKINLLLIGTLFFSFTSLAYVSALSMAVHVPEKYTDVAAGERFYFEVEIKHPENPSRKDVNLKYEILTSEEELIAQAKALKAIENQASFLDFMVIPESTNPGLHLIKVNIQDFEDLNEEVEASFRVVLGNSGQIRMYFFILLGVMVIVGGLIVFQIVSSRRNRIEN